MKFKKDRCYTLLFVGGKFQFLVLCGCKSKFKLCNLKEKQERKKGFKEGGVSVGFVNLCKLESVEKKETQ